jgi:glucose/arabinose dehydrogenase
MRDIMLLLITIILSALTLISEYPSYSQYQKEEETDFDQLQVEEADVRINDPDLKLELVSTGLTFPTNMAFLGQDDILVLENGKGTLRRIINGSLLPEPLLSVASTPPLQSFMCGIAIAKNNNNPVYIFLYFTEWERGKERGNRLYRYVDK